MSKNVRRNMYIFVTIVVVAVMFLIVTVLISYTYNARKTIKVGDVYQAEKSHYPVSVKALVFDKGFLGYNMSMNGDLLIDLPEGSSNIKLIPPKKHNDPFASTDNCPFQVYFLDQTGTSQIWSWKNCLWVNGLLVIPHEIYFE